MADDVRCYLARVKNYHKPYASIEFSNGHIEKRLFVYTADEKPIKPGDEVYVCVIGDEILQFCEVRPARKLGKMPNRNPKKEKKIEKEEATCQINRKRKYVLEKKKFESRAGGKMLDLKQLGKECSVPPGMTLLEKRQQITKDELGKIALLISILRFALPIYVTVLFYAIIFSTYADDSVQVLLKGLAIVAPFFLLLLYATRVFRRRNCIQAGDVRCYIARVKNYDKPYADVEFSNGCIEKRLFVYTADGRQVNPGDEVYVCIIENENLKDLQFCEVRLISELGKVSSQKLQKRKKSEKKKKSHAR